jgi:hypothetical protein
MSEDKVSLYEQLKRIEQFTWSPDHLRRLMFEDLRELSTNIGLICREHADGSPVEGMDRAWLAAMIHVCTRLLETAEPAMSVETALQGYAEQELMSYCTDDNVEAARATYREQMLVTSPRRIELPDGKSVIALISPHEQITRDYHRVPANALMPNPHRELMRLAEYSFLLRKPD